GRSSSSMVESSSSFVRGSSSRTRSRRPEAAFLLLSVLCCPALPCLAGESYLDRSKARDAVPYGTSIEPPAAHGDTQAPGASDAAGSLPAKRVTSSTLRLDSKRPGPDAPATEAR